MAANNARPLSEVLDKLEESASGETVSFGEIVEKLGHKSFASLMLIFSLISTSPASAIPGVTASVAAIVFLLVAQMLAGRACVWLPDFAANRRLSTSKLRAGLTWLRKPVRFVEGFMRERLTFLVHRPWLYLPLGLILILTMLMPFMEIIPTSGSIASAVIALFAAGLLTRDGAVVVLAFGLLAALPLAIWQFGFR